MTEQANKPSDTSGEDRQTRLGKLMQRRPIAFALAFEGGLAVVAIVIALIFGLRPWLDMDFDTAAIARSLLATAPLVVAVLALMQMRWRWVKNLEEIVRDHLLPLFRKAGPAAILAVALAAGIGEEMLFRGVVQTGLSELIGPVTALALASLLFGLAHAITPAYFLLTCLMGFYLGWLYLASGNLLVPIAVHFLYDWIVLSWYLFLKHEPD